MLDIRVGYEETHFTTPEGNVLVMLCAIIYEPSSGVAPRSFNLSYMTEDYTAGRYCVYIFAEVYATVYKPLSQWLCAIINTMSTNSTNKCPQCVHRLNIIVP